MEWWQIALIIAGIVPVAIALVFTIYACVRVGARSDKEGKDDEN